MFQNGYLERRRTHDVQTMSNSKASKDRAHLQFQKDGPAYHVFLLLTNCDDIATTTIAMRTVETKLFQLLP